LNSRSARSFIPHFAAIYSAASSNHGIIATGFPGGLFLFTIPGEGISFAINPGYYLFIHLN
jgi:hypothetical protein